MKVLPTAARHFIRVFFYLAAASQLVVISRAFDLGVPMAITTSVSRGSGLDDVGRTLSAAHPAVMVLANTRSEVLFISHPTTMFLVSTSGAMFFVRNATTVNNSTTAVNNATTVNNAATAAVNNPTAAVSNATAVDDFANDLLGTRCQFIQSEHL